MYGFATAKGKSRLFAISVDNVSHEAFGLFDAPETPKNSGTPYFVFQPLNLRGITTEIFDALHVAETNGLGEFSSLAPGRKANVSMHLANSAKGPVWCLTGDGWDENGPIADLSIVIDATTGKVVSRTLERATNR